MGNIYVGMIRRASVASGMVPRMSDAARTPYPTYRPVTFGRLDKTRQRRIRHGTPGAGCGVNAYLWQLLYAR
ncbi:hypothetical protein D9742_10265 [Escherichia sp. E1V33]|nr:hypothetical protein D9742_10265 [Escherichia sp. E1V33]TBR69544.1 hypothetical protein D9735_02825 [Escherichia sp. E1S7]